ncbi:hypothetical protein GQ457_03G018710 [Hibiscus cannabinus]
MKQAVSISVWSVPIPKRQKANGHQQHWLNVVPIPSEAQSRGINILLRRSRKARSYIQPTGAMASNPSFVGFEEGQSITCPPLFKGDSYFQWCHQMEFFIKALDFDLWKIIEDDYVEVPKKKKNRSSKDMGKTKKNAKAMHTVLFGLNDDVSKKVSSCKSDKEM